MNGSRRGSPLRFGLALALATLAGVDAQAPPVGFGEAVDVELVAVDVWVTDRQGRPVGGLAASDFELLHDGEPVVVTHFTEVGAGAAASPVTAEAAPAEPAGTAVAPGYLVLYFDQLHLQPRDYGPLLEGVDRLLAEGAVPAERVMVLRQDRDLHLEVPFGSPRAVLDAALRRIAATRAAGDIAQSEQVVAAVSRAWQESEQLSSARGRGLSSIPEVDRTGDGSPRAAVGGAGSGGGGGMGPDACDLFVDRVQGTVEAWVRERADRTAITVRHLHQAGAVLSGLPGVKTLVYLSDALETEPASPLAAAVGSLCPGQSLDLSRPEMPRDLLALTRHLNTNQVTVHALQASGLRVAESGTAGARTFAGGPGAARIGSAFESAQRNSERRGLGVLADETGGRLVFNQNELGTELTRIARDMQTYYSLAYRPPRGAAAGEHRIEVRLRDRSLQPRYRRGYREKDGEERLREQLEGVLYLGLTANPLNVRVGAGEVRPRGERFVLPLHVFVPVGSLTFVEAGGSAAAELRMQVLARNAASPRQEWQRKAFRVVRPAEVGGAADLGVELELEPGTNVVAIALRDEASRATSLVSTTLEVGR
jgi:VWFA-related protein